jgi:LysR substrate binding domain
VTTGAHDFLAGALVVDFLAQHPHVRLAVEVGDEPTDIVADGYDAGIEIGEVIEKDMIVVPVSDELELAIVGAPSYFARHPAPDGRGARGDLRRHRPRGHQARDTRASPRGVLSAVPRVLPVLPAASTGLARATRIRRVPPRRAQGDPQEARPLTDEKAL